MGVEWAIQCDERTKALSLPTHIRNNLLASQWIWAGLIHPKEVIGRLISEEIMQESSFFEYISEYFDETREKSIINGDVTRGAKKDANRDANKESNQGAEQGAREAPSKSLRDS